ncbi:hypothetical protein BpHYR1_008276 [Brachionus plicatilis]|uniref:Uncharacterized protein n=1 Tax=Brachionus plicatilis TaxID=10195 RepID=A0A3M7ST65_BRAPC|nr:hypothetical protein BpHYR1_008276 [Brachionus plicatilis]
MTKNVKKGKRPSFSIQIEGKKTIKVDISKQNSIFIITFEKLKKNYLENYAFKINYFLNNCFCDIFLLNNFASDDRESELSYNIYLYKFKLV